MYCKNCGKQIDPNAAICVGCGVAVGTGTTFCPNCGNQTAPGAAACVNCGVALGTAIAGSNKSRLVALLLCVFLGGIGIHRFYVGKVGTGILYIFTAGLFGIGTLVDLIMIIVGSFKDIDGNLITNWES